MGKKIEYQKRTITRMVQLYCKHKLKTDTVPEEYQQLIAYAHRRLDRCRWGEDKPACKRCPTHCYEATRRQRMREIMRWAGMRMIFLAPWDAIKHALNR